MTVPSTVQVGPMRYRVACDPAAFNAVQADWPRGLMGHTRHTTLEMTIKPDLAPDQERDTVLHETLHCLFTLAAPRMDDEVEEGLIASLSPLLLDALRRNPALVAYLVEDGA